MDADSHRAYAMHLLNLKRFDQTLSQAKPAQRLDPVSFAVNEAMAIVDLNTERVDEAEAEARNLKELYPDYDLSKILGQVCLKKWYKGALWSKSPAVNGR